MKKFVKILLTCILTLITVIPSFAAREQKIGQVNQLSSQFHGQ